MRLVRMDKRSFPYRPVDVAKPIALMLAVAAIPIWHGLTTGRGAWAMYQSAFDLGWRNGLAVMAVEAATVGLGVFMALTNGRIRVVGDSIEKRSFGFLSTVIPIDEIVEISKYDVMSGSRRIANIHVQGPSARIRFSSRIMRYEELMRVLRIRAPASAFTFEDQ
ncbi:hypothetical protein TMPK1_36620 [Rhodospirillales bacterium TMPK1]|uniref:Uncharacterized protein n=2 Tax=Roseiterribacter gracilis TaxID=2812848 RepID=A0A8S8XJQ5_9PROT|nr:hypothetical protein TMPK1_36620 [Rhodospirillales bacterium TMPK1]